MTISEPGEGTSLPFPAKSAIASYPPTDSGFTTFVVIEGLDGEALDALNLPPGPSYFVRNESYIELYHRAKELESNYRATQSALRLQAEDFKQVNSIVTACENEIATLKISESSLTRAIEKQRAEISALQSELHMAQEAASDARKEVENTREFWNTAHSGLQSRNRERIEFIDADPPTLEARMDTVVAGFELLWMQNKELSNRQLLADQRISAIEPTVASLEKHMTNAEKEFPIQIAQIRRMIQWDREFFGKSIATQGKFDRKLAKKVRKLQQVP